jgi:tetratricopeptide (TPR) repeat protein
VAYAIQLLGVALREVGRYDEALTAGQEAVKLYRQLADDRPEVYLGDLANAVGDMGIHQGEVGRNNEALATSQEAVKLYRRLVGDRPEVYLGYLASAVGGLGEAFHAVGITRHWRLAKRRSSCTGGWSPTIRRSIEATSPWRFAMWGSI